MKTRTQCLAPLLYLSPCFLLINCTNMAPPCRPPSHFLLVLLFHLRAKHCIVHHGSATHCYEAFTSIDVRAGYVHVGFLRALCKLSKCWRVAALVGLLRRGMVVKCDAWL